MKRGFIASVLLHAVILGLAFFGLPFVETKRPDVAVIPIEIVPDAQIAEVTTPAPRAEPEPEPEPEPAPAPEPEPEAEPEPEPEPEEVQAPPPPPEPAPAPPPPPAQTAEAVPPLEEVTPEAERKPEVEPAPAPEPRPTTNIQPRTKPEPPSRFDTSRVAALLDKKDEPRPEPQPQPPQPALDLNRVAENLGRRSIDNQRQLATLKAMIQQQIYRCWSIPAGMKDASSQVVRVRILLRPDGSLIGNPEILNKERYNDPDGSRFDVAARAAVNAVLRCTPLDLPRDRYEDWREVIQNFDPSQMLDVN